MEKWIKELPRSRMVYPTAMSDQMKYWFWRFYTPLHPLVRGVSSRLGVSALLLRCVVPESKLTGRQDFLLGTLDPARSPRELVLYLIGQGFANHFVAWKDAEELVSLRRVVDFKHQYHIRIFKDGEVRCHYELTPEYRPVRHLIRVGFEDRAPEFEQLLRGWLVPSA